MDPAALASLCILLTHGAPGTLPPGLDCHQAAAPAATVSAALVTGADARDGIARVAYSEAANQGDSGLAAVVYTILNRLGDGRWGGSVDAVLNAPHQFEPVMRAGGDWRKLPQVSEARQARIDTIINLALEGRLPDLTNGARYFQNPRIVADRAGAGQVPASLVNFGGAPPSAVIGAHSFYAEAGRGGGRRQGGTVAAPSDQSGSNIVMGSAGGAIFVRADEDPVNKDAELRRSDPDPAPAPVDVPADSRAAGTPRPEGAMFVIASPSGGDH